MQTSNNQDIVILLPGEIYFTQEPKKIKTILGSCVAITVWHAKQKVGGICHYIVSNISGECEANHNNYRYGKYALDYLLKQMSMYAPITEFEMRLFGGGNMYACNSTPSIGEANIIYAKQWAKQHNIDFIQQDVLGNICRSITFNSSTGIILLQRYSRENIGIEHGN